MPPNWCEPITVLTIVLAACALFQVILFIFQLVVLGRQTQMLNRQITLTQNDQRAWLGPKGISPSVPRKGAAFEAIVIVENSGNTPALNAKPAVAGRVLPVGVPFFPWFDGETQSSMVFYPRATANSPIAPLELSDEEIGRIQEGLSVLYVYGRIPYRDVFGRDHCSTFAAAYDPKDGTWGHLDTYNAAD